MNVTKEVIQEDNKLIWKARMWMMLGNHLLDRAMYTLSLFPALSERARHGLYFIDRLIFSIIILKLFGFSFDIMEPGRVWLPIIALVGFTFLLFKIRCKLGDYLVDKANNVFIEMQQKYLTIRNEYIVKSYIDLGYGCNQFDGRNVWEVDWECNSNNDTEYKIIQNGVLRIAQKDYRDYSFVCVQQRSLSNLHIDGDKCMVMDRFCQCIEGGYPDFDVEFQVLAENPIKGKVYLSNVMMSRIMKHAYLFDELSQNQIIIVHNKIIAEFEVNSKISLNGWFEKSGLSEFIQEYERYVEEIRKKERLLKKCRIFVRGEER